MTPIFVLISYRRTITASGLDPTETFNAPTKPVVKWDFDCVTPWIDRSIECSQFSTII